MISLRYRLTGWAELQPVEDMIYNRVDRGVNVRNDGFFARAWFLQRVELALEQGRRHEVPLAQLEPPGNQVAAPLEIDHPDIVPAVHQNLAIASFQGRAGDDGMFAVSAYPVDLVGDGLQPWPAVLVGQGMSGAHLLDVAFGMKSVAVLASPAQSLGEFA